MNADRAERFPYGMGGLNRDKRTALRAMPPTGIQRRMSDVSADDAEV